MNQDLIDRALRVATQMAADRGVEVDQDTLTRALVAVTGESDGQDDPAEIAEDALELLGKTFVGTVSSRRGRRPF